eukprot:TRINITY_DN14578_c0_g1_i1.p1 TRINITY_DN14578_c0_g1~~TRINITY_DN14578_c0_g1_i1.p1  ORF type:complete len:562 (+),score=83.97 TRINITY_DN14578_c0_g1_i1:231-1916(+)
MAGLDLGIGHIIFCPLSPLHPVTVSTETRGTLHIPPQAALFAFAYPATLDGMDTSRLSLDERQVSFLKYGGYLYFTDQRDVVGVTSLFPGRLGTKGLRFGRPQTLPDKIAGILTKHGRFQKITLDSLAHKGATHFAWVRPEEFGDSIACPHGCFAYTFARGGPKYFPVVEKPVFTQGMLETTLADTEAWVVIRVLCRPTIERFIIFDRTKPLESNLRKEYNSSAKAALGYLVSVGRDSDPDLSLSYKRWSGLADKASVVDPWVLMFEPDGVSSPAAKRSQIMTFPHHEFENRSETCWLSCLFQSLWHSVVFHAAFDHYLAQLEPENRLLTELLSTWGDYQDASEATLLKLSHFAEVFRSQHSQIFDGTSGCCDASEALAIIQEQLSASSSAAAQEIAAGICFVPCTGAARPDSIWEQVKELKRTRANLLAIDLLDFGSVQPSQTEIQQLAQVWADAQQKMDAQSGRLDADARPFGGYRMVAIVCFKFSCPHYVIFCRRQENPHACIFFNDVPHMTDNIGKLELPWSDVPSMCRQYSLAPKLVLLESLSAVKNAGPCTCKRP